MSEENVQNRRYTDEFRQEAARLVNSVGHLEASRRGRQYASWRDRELAKECGMTMSMSRRANARGNAPMGRFFKTLKVEQTSRCRYETRAHARLDVVDWIEGFYNR